jgi:hypothetical protein
MVPREQAVRAATTSRSLAALRMTRFRFPSLSPVTREELIGIGRVRELHLLGVVIDLATRARPHGGDTETHRFSEPGGVLERRARLVLTLAGAHPVHLVARRHARDRHRHHGAGVADRAARRVEARIVSIGFVDEDSLITHEDAAAFRHELHVIGQALRTRRIESTIIPEQLDRTTLADGREVVVDRGRHGI